MPPGWRRQESSASLSCEEANNKSAAAWLLGQQLAFSQEKT
jgi:hypothetical protein